jgi:AmmeMemoRadiSam system protein A
VTINIDRDSLRGCIGSLLPHKTLMDDVIYNAKAAAFSDRRFFPLAESEYPYCSIEISILTLPEELAYTDAADLKAKIRPGVDGVVLQTENHSATFLPQVWEAYPGFDQFFGQLGIKAGIRRFALDTHPNIFIYQAERFEDSPLEEAYDACGTDAFATPQAAEKGFYGALERGDLEAMLSVWADDEGVVCIHPGGERLQGRTAVDRSWRDMLAGQPIMRFDLEDVNYTGDAKLSIHTLRERISVNGQLAGVALATNVYRLGEDGWRLLMHHTSPDPAVMRQQ